LTVCQENEKIEPEVAAYLIGIIRRLSFSGEGISAGAFGLDNGEGLAIPP
jgi:hypothetical protein